MKRIKIIDREEMRGFKALATLAVLGGPEVRELHPALETLKVSDSDREVIQKAQEKRERKLERNRRNGKS